MGVDTYRLIFLVSDAAEGESEQKIEEVFLHFIAEMLSQNVFGFLEVFSPGEQKYRNRENSFTD